MHCRARCEYNQAGAYVVSENAKSKKIEKAKKNQNFKNVEHYSTWNQSSLVIMEYNWILFILQGV